MSEVASTGTPGAFGRWGLRLLHVRPGAGATIPIQKWRRPGRPDANSLMFTGRPGEDIWATSGPDMQVVVRWADAHVYPLPGVGDIRVMHFIPVNRYTNELDINLSLRPYALQIPHISIENVTGAATARMKLEGIEYRDIHRGERHILRSGSHVAFAITQPASPGTTPPMEDTALPAELRAMLARFEASELQDATGVAFWFLHCVRPL